MKKGVFFVVLLVTFPLFSDAQVSPPGLGKAAAASWFAVGVRQELDTIKDKGWQSVTYAGLGRKSNPNDANPFLKSAILVLNQEFYHQFHHNWEHSFALSYRKQDEYQEVAPYFHDSPKFEQEFRTYARLSYSYKHNRIKVVPTLRQEFRKFYAPDFSNMHENFQLRTRLRLQFKAYLDTKKIHRIILGSEQLFAISNLHNPSRWTSYSYKESRFTLYYAFSPQKTPFIISAGYMYDLVGSKNVYDVHYLAFDVVLENIFKLRKRDKEAINENFE